MLPNEEASHAAAAISGRQRTILSQILQDLRQTLSHMRLPKVTPLSALDATAIDALKDLYYLANTEDPLNTMPIRRHILNINITSTLLLPLLSLLHSDPAAKTNPKRWSVPIYHSLRLFSVLTSPVLRENGLLPPASSLDDSLQDLRAKLADSPIIDAYVALLQYYLDRKARKADALAAAEESKLEDARIDNILRFFRNLLSPPRTSAGEHLQTADKGVHYAVVRSLVKTDFYSTLSILFASKEDARGQYTDLVFITAEIYALTFRHSTPKQFYQAYRRTVSEKVRTQRGDVLSVQQDIRKRRSANLRAALQRERAVIGGSRAVRAGARWTSRHSGGFTAASKAGSNTTTKKIISARKAIQSNLTFNPKRPLQEAIQVNSEILCLLTAKGRSRSGVVHKKIAAPIKQDVVEDGLRGIVTLTTEFVEICFEYFVRELRERIEEIKQRSKAEETETLMTAQKSFVAIVGAVVGFHRERFGKIRRDTTENTPSLNAQLHDNCMKALLSSDFKIVKSEWKAVEAGIELETFQLVFRVLVESCEALRENGKDDEKVQIVELATSAVLEMMKMLQGMAANSKNDNEEQIDQDTDKKSNLTPREIALNTLEQLFERQSFLNAPAELAKDFSTKMFSFRHLTNIVEVAHAFTTILLDEQELARLQVTKQKRNKTKKRKADEEKNGEDSDPEFRINQKDTHKDEKEGQEENTREQDDHEQRVKKKKKIIESDEEEEEEATTVATPSASHLVAEKPSGENQSAPLEEPSESVPDNEDGKPKADGSRKPVEGTRSTEQDGIQKQLLEDADDEMKDLEKGAATSSDKPAKELSKVQQMLMADAEHDSQSPSIKPKESEKEDENNKDQSQTQTLSKVQLMLMADKERDPEKPQTAENTDLNKLSAVQSMLLADAKEEGKETEMPRLVSTIEEMRTEANKDKAKAKGDAKNGGTAKTDGDDDGSDDSEDEPELREIESIGIIRRFAHAKALQTLVLPVRAALCEASSLSGISHPIPEGSSPLLSPIVIAKSAHVLAAIWRVAKIRERGVQCGQFFSYSTMHLMNIALSTTKQCAVRKDSVLERFSVFAKDVTKEFFSWLTINPGLSLDMFFPMDKNSCNMYVSYMRQKALADSRQAVQEDSGNESDMSLLEIEKRVDSAAANGVEKARGSNGTRNVTSRAGKRRMRERRRAARENIEEDEDVDDIDNLDLGIDEGHESVEDSPVAPRSRKGKRARKQSFDPFDSDEEHLQSKVRKKRVAKAKKVAKRVKQSAAKKAQSTKPTFSSSDEYSDLVIDSGMELSDGEKDDANPPGDKNAANSGTPVTRNPDNTERPVRRLKLKPNFSESPDMLDEEEEDGHSSSESDDKTSAGIPTPASEKSKSRTGDDSPGKQDGEPLREEGDPSPLHTELVRKATRSDRKSRRVMVSDDDSE